MKLMWIKMRILLMRIPVLKYLFVIVLNFPEWIKLFIRYREFAKKFGYDAAHKMMHSDRIEKLQKDKDELAKLKHENDQLNAEYSRLVEMKKLKETR